MDLIALVLAGSVLATAAVVISPTLLRASFQTQQELALPAQEDHRDTLQKLADLIGKCKGLAAIHDRVRTPYLDIVLWVKDLNGDSQINNGELMVISHSHLLRTITAYTCEMSDSFANTTANVSDMLLPDFGERWRSQATVEGRVIGADVSDMHFVGNDASGGNTGAKGYGVGTYMIELTWNDENTDESDTGQAIVRLLRILPGGGPITNGQSEDN